MQVQDASFLRKLSLVNICLRNTTNVGKNSVYVSLVRQLDQSNPDLAGIFRGSICDVGGTIGCLKLVRIMLKT